MRYRMTLRQLQDLYGTEQAEDVVSGLSPGGAATHLSITRQAIDRAVKRGSLDMVEFIDDAGHRCAQLITMKSIRRYERSPYRKRA